MKEGTSEPLAPSSDIGSGPKKRRGLWLLVPTAIVLVVLGFNWISLYQPARSALSEDIRNQSAEVAVYHRWGISPKEIVFDLRRVSGTVSRADVTRMLFQVAEAFENREYDWVILAYKGEARLKIRGSHFQEIGHEVSFQNPIYLMRKLPQNVYELDGSPAFSSYTGGWLGVLGAEMDDLNELHDRWWLDEALH